MTGRSDPPAAVRWEMDGEQAEDLAAVLGLLEDFLRHASPGAITELAGYRPARPLHPCRWAHWLADYLGDHVVALRAATRAATGPTSTGDPQ